MFTKTARRTLLALALILCLLPAAAQAGVFQISRSEARVVAARVQEGNGIFSAVWKGLTFLWEKAGAGIDPTGGTGEPDGTSGSGSGNGGSDEGASIDPNGTPGN
jgi:hypothetical protein